MQSESVHKNYTVLEEWSFHITLCIIRHRRWAPAGST